MIWLRILILAFAYLCIMYYVMLVLQLFGCIKFTNRNMTFLRCMLPFYFWVMPQDEVKKKTN